MGVVGRLSLVCLGLVACENADGTRPVIPPSEVLEPDLSIAATAPAAAFSADPHGDSKYTNFASAYSFVDDLWSYAGGSLALPVAALRYARMAAATQDGDMWIWNQDVADVHLSLEIGGQGKDWGAELYVSGSGLDRFLWMEGVYAVDLSVGSMVFHRPYVSGDDTTLALGWELYSSSSLSVEFEDINPTDGRFGVRHVLGLAEGLATLDVYAPGDSGPLAKITLDTNTGAGSYWYVHAAAARCWDRIFENIECP